MRDACVGAVASVFSALRESILKHWSEDLDVGREITVQLHEVPFNLVSEAASWILALQDVMQANLQEAPVGGMATIRVIGRVKAQDVARELSQRLGKKYTVGMAGPNVVEVQIAGAPGQLPAEPGQKKAPEDGKAVWPEEPVPPGEPTAEFRPVSYLVPAAIVGGSVVVAIALAALILRRR